MKKRKFPLVQLLAAAAVAGVVCWFLMAVSKVHTDHSRQGAAQLADAVRKAAVACYAAEGIYPPTVQYLTDHYGIQIDREKYHVFYEVFAENLMPDITVLTAQ